MAPEQLLFFALFLLLALFNLVARWLRSRMGSRPPGEVTEEEAPPRGEEPYEVREIPAPREMPVPREVPAPRETLPEREIPPPRRTQRPGPGREPLRREPAPLPPRARELPVSLEEVRERLAVSLEERARAQAPVSLEEMRAPTRAVRPPAPRVARPRPGLRLDDPRELRRAIVLREILGPPGGLERSERDG